MKVLNGNWPTKKSCENAVVEKAPAGAQYRLAFAFSGPMQSSSRGEKLFRFTIVEFVETTRANLNETTRGIEVAKAIALFSDDSEVIPAQTKVEGHAWTPAKSVLDEPRVRILKSAAT